MALSDADHIKTRVTWVGAGINTFLVLIKIGFGIIGQSAGLIADGVHSLSDLASDLVVVMAVRLGGREADHDHPYGHRRYETLATVALGLMLIGIALGFGWDMIERLGHAETLPIPSRETLGVALISILANEWLFHYSRRHARATRSNLLMANAWHHRSDAVSSIVVLIGIAGSLLGYAQADVIAAGVVALMIAKIGLQLVKQSISELVDTSLPEQDVKAFRRLVKGTPGVRGIHLLRSRQMGEDAYIDVHIVVDPKITVSEGHRIGDRVRLNLLNEFDHVVDVLVHVDPIDDEFLEPQQLHPLLERAEMECLLEETLGDAFQWLEDIRIHYLDNRLELELLLPALLHQQPDRLEQLKQLSQTLRQQTPAIDKVTLLIKL
ncbi:MAG: cation diffusion facilitator family transporter [Methylococcales bacterium]|nr:cation diffusion facilitator family transporter [Methylococcales bacterium]